jgi:KaiC/GvpD/RAD55 family RecA-like ATPase
LLAADRTAVERTARDLVLGVVEQRTPTGVSVAVQGAPGIGKTFLVSRP